MELNSIPLSTYSAYLLYVPVSHLMKHTLMACDPNEIANEEYRAIYADGIWSEEKLNARWKPSSFLGITVMHEPLFTLAGN